MEQILNREIKGLITEYPAVGKILDEYGVGCVPCSVGTCLLKDIVDIHNLTPEAEMEMMTAIARAVYPGREIAIPPRARKSDARSAKPNCSPPVQKLVDEHTFIKRWAALLPLVAETLELDTESGRGFILNGLNFIRLYADKYHHAKEEEILFKYFDDNLDILKVMRDDHDTARAHVRAVAGAVEQRDVRAAREHLLAYAKLLQEHIKKEDEILYPWMDRQFSDTQVGELFARFRNVDEEFGDTPREQEKFVEYAEKRLEVMRIRHGL